MSTIQIPTMLEENKLSLVSWGLDVQPPIPYNQDSWRGYLSGNTDFEDVCKRHPFEISRKDISNISCEAWLHPSETNVNRLFLVSMIWGYGTVGYGPYRTAEMLKTPNYARTLLKVFKDVQSGDIETAYHFLCIDRCGPAFFTKFLYFAGLGGSLELMPLILDSRVGNGLECVFGQSQVSFLKVERDQNGKIVFIARDWNAYVAYLNLVHGWADEFGCRPDAFEYWLFSLN